MLFDRRQLFVAGGVAALAGVGMSASTVLPVGHVNSVLVAGRPRAGVPQEHKIQWGQDPQRQVGQLFLPDPGYWAQGAGRPVYPVVMFIHGGGWTDDSGPAYCRDAAQDVARYGVAVWLPTYRGTPSPGGWPATFEDISDALDYVAELGEHASFEPDLRHVHVMGHSAGGHLAVWVAGRDHMPASAPGGVGSSAPDSGGSDIKRVRVHSVTSLAGVLDFKKAVYEDNDQWVVDLMGGSPKDYPDRYNMSSPINQLPMKIPINVVHGKSDSVVPVSTLRDYIYKHSETGNSGKVIIVNDVGHNEFVDVVHPAWNLAKETCLRSLGSR